MKHTNAHNYEGNFFACPMHPEIEVPKRNLRGPILLKKSSPTGVIFILFIVFKPKGGASV